jgi:hypothetical protein
MIPARTRRSVAKKRKIRRCTIIGIYILGSTLALLLCGSSLALLLYGSSLVTVVVVDPSNKYIPWETTGGRRSAADTDTDTDTAPLGLGIQSMKPNDYFKRLQDTIDQDDDQARCKRYGYSYSNSNTDTPDRPRRKEKRRIFYGSMIADEPWELFEIIAAETHGIFAGMVFVESNRTQNFSKRRFQRLASTETFQELFGMSTTEQRVNVQVRPYVNEEGGRNQGPMTREHAQRAEILKGWKELGMTSQDVGYLTDSDETFTRDFLRAVQVCDGIDQLDYHKHYCAHAGVKMISNTRVFQGSPECISEGQSWFHPDMIIGACLEGIGDETMHPKAPRWPGSFLRAKGFGGEGFGNDCTDWEGESKIVDNRYPLLNAADFRRLCGGRMVGLNTREFPEYGPYTGYHFHNFFANADAIRFKYRTYGHVDANAYTKRLEKMNNALQMMYRCVMNLTESRGQKWKRVKGGFGAIQPQLPVYFHDADYRYRRHEFMRQVMTADDKALAKRNQTGA